MLIILVLFILLSKCIRYILPDLIGCISRVLLIWIKIQYNMRFEIMTWKGLIIKLTILISSISITYRFFPHISS